jgi:pterin-4a-carbinolamine dehydratase
MPVSDDAIEQAMRGLPGWGRFGDQLVKTFVRDDFHAAVLFTTRIAAVAEALGRQPDIAIHGNEVTLTLDGSAGTVTADDLALARRIQRLVGDHRHPIGLAGP